MKAWSSEINCFLYSSCIFIDVLMWSEVNILSNLFLMFVVAVYFNIYELGLFGSADLRTFQIAEIYTGPIAAYQIQRIYATQKNDILFLFKRQ